MALFVIFLMFVAVLSITEDIKNVKEWNVKVEDKCVY